MYNMLIVNLFLDRTYLMINILSNFRMFADNYVLLINMILITVLSILTGMLIFITLKYKGNLKSGQEFEHITEALQLGVVKFQNENKFRINYVSPRFLNMLGYEDFNKKQLLSIIDIISPLDLEKFKNDITNGSKNEGMQLEVRVIGKNNQVIWTLANVNKTINKNGKVSVIIMFVDVTQSKKMLDQIILEQERYHIASELSNDILFEYNVDEDLMVFAHKFEEITGKNSTVFNFSKLDLKYSDLIHPEDRGIFSEYLRALRSGEEFIESEYRMINKMQKYVWSHTIGKTIYDEQKKPIRVIGKVVNIDMHKKELQNLEFKARRDPLTGVYNKMITKELIDSFIKHFPLGNHVFMIIDIDDFKGINDTYGHHQGDKVLTFVIGEVKKIFKTGEILGRIGGDEFVVFIGNVESTQLIHNRAELLLKTLRTTYSNSRCSINISGSIGVAKYPEDGGNYNELLVCADRALYNAKGKGKDGYVCYKYEVDNEGMNNRVLENI